MIRWIAALWLALIAAPLAAQSFPALDGRVVDKADLLTPAQESDLTSKLAALETRSGRQFAVATVPGLEGRTIEDYGYRLGRHWGIGDAKRDDGVILLVAPAERKVRIETGYGARVFLTDAVSSIIIRDTILPRFKAGDMPGGIIAGADAITQMMELPAAEAAKRAKEMEAADKARAAAGGGINLSGLVFFAILFFFIVLPILRGLSRGRRGRRKGGIDPMVVLWGLDVLGDIASSGRRGGGGGFGGFGGGGGGFSGGGGGFGGGGASGGW